MRLPFRECAAVSWCPTMATDGYHVFYNPVWVERLSDAQMRGVIAHEVLHVLLAHSDRLQHRDDRRWNVACDHATNLILVEQGFTLPQGGLYSRGYVGLTSEEIYERLDAEAELATRLFAAVTSSGSEHEQSGIVADAGADLLSADDPRIAPLRDRDTPDREQLAELRQELRSEAARGLRGLAASQFRVECVASDSGYIDWRVLLRQWLLDRIKTDWSMYPYAKKHIHRGLYMPSIGVESPGQIVFAFDTSGSMSESDLRDIVGELRAFRETFPCRLTVIQADAQIQDVQQFAEFDGTEVPKTLTLRGRGGTSFRPVFEWLGQESSQSSVVVLYATDGFGDFPAQAPQWPVIWLLTADGVAQQRIPFGMCIRLPR
jgi:predicted metal-dependent peptidase